MAYSYVLANDIGKLRLLIKDNNGASLALFQDEEIQTFLDLEDGVLKRGAALALETIASDEALVQKVLVIEDAGGKVQTDGSKTAKALMDRARLLREQAGAAVEESVEGLFDWAEIVTGLFSARERIASQGLRNA